MHRQPIGSVGTSLCVHRETSGFVGVSPTGLVNAQGAQRGCRYIPVNAHGDQLDCTVSGDEPGVQRVSELCGVCVCV